MALYYGLNRIKKVYSDVSAYHDINDLEQIDNLQSHEDEQFQQILRKEEEQIIQDALKKLPRVYRIPIILYYYDNMSYKTISKLLNVKEGTIKSHIFRAKKILKAQMET